MIKVRFSYLASKKRGKKFNNWSENKKKNVRKASFASRTHSLIDYNVSITIPCSVSDSVDRDFIGRNSKQVVLRIFKSGLCIYTLAVNVEFTFAVCA